MGNKEIVDILLLNNADPLIKDKDEHNALSWGIIEFKYSINIILILEFFYSYKASAYPKVEEIFNKHDSKLIKNNSKSEVSLIYGKLVFIILSPNPRIPLFTKKNIYHNITSNFTIS